MTRKSKEQQTGDMMQGTLDMLVLRTLLLAPAHGHTIAYAIEQTSGDLLQVIDAVRWRTRYDITR